MKSVRVQYKVKDAYVEKNKANIKAVMDDLRSSPIEGLHYSSYYLGEGRFMHLNVSSNEAANKRLNENEHFTRFRTELKASGPVEPPKGEDQELVGSNRDMC